MQCTGNPHQHTVSYRKGTSVIHATIKQRNLHSDNITGALCAPLEIEIIVIPATVAAPIEPPNRARTVLVEPIAVRIVPVDVGSLVQVVEAAAVRVVLVVFDLLAPPRARAALARCATAAL
eukprot:149628-Pyramimonas_sp.AAC.1